MENCSNFCVITTVYFEDRKWISKTVFCISSSMVCKIVFCSEFFDIRDNAAKKVTRKRRRTETIVFRFELNNSERRQVKTDPIFNPCSNFFRYTSKGLTTFALMIQWPENNLVRLHQPIPTANTKVSLLGYSSQVTWSGAVGSKGLMIDLGSVKQRPCEWAWVFQLEAVEWVT